MPNTIATTYALIFFFDIVLLFILFNESKKERLRFFYLKKIHSKIFKWIFLTTQHESKNIYFFYIRK